MHLVFLALLLAADPPAWDEVYQATKPSIPYLFSTGHLCAGSLVAPDRVLTAWHCVASLREVTVGWEGGWMRGRVIAARRIDDLALLELSTPVDRRPLVPRDTALLVGMPIAAIGHPFAIKISEPHGVDPELTHTLTTGVVANLHDATLITDMALNPGNSGGPLLDAQGHIVGVASRITGGLISGQSLGYSPAPERVRDFLAAPGEQPSIWRASQRVTLALRFDSVLGGGPRFDGDARLGLLLAVDFWSRLHTYFLSEVAGATVEAGAGYVLPIDFGGIFYFEAIPHVGYALVPERLKPEGYPNAAGITLRGFRLRLDANAWLRRDAVVAWCLGLGIDVMEIPL